MEELGINAGIKWPNDIVAHGKKVCGILTEMSAEPDYIHYVVIGCGINVNQMVEKSETLQRPCPGRERITRSACFCHHGAFRKA
ncbi:MAG: biotin--[acetyl-CoA-carboxylase] ligase [Eisenbergiella massiliensis]